MTIVNYAALSSENLNVSAPPAHVQQPVTFPCPLGLSKPGNSSKTEADLHHVTTHAVQSTQSTQPSQCPNAEEHLGAVDVPP